MNWAKRHPKTIAVLLDCMMAILRGVVIGLALSCVLMWLARS